MPFYYFTSSFYSSAWSFVSYYLGSAFVITFLQHFDGTILYFLSVIQNCAFLLPFGGGKECGEHWAEKEEHKNTGSRINGSE